MRTNFDNVLENDIFHFLNTNFRSFGAAVLVDKLHLIEKICIN